MAICGYCLSLHKRSTHTPRSTNVHFTDFLPKKLIFFATVSPREQSSSTQNSELVTYRKGLSVKTKIPRQPGIPFFFTLPNYGVFALSFRSRDDDPTRICLAPDRIQRFCVVDQYSKARGEIWIATSLDVPAARVTRANAARVRTAYCTPSGRCAGASRYTCGTSSPASVPVFLMRTETSNPWSAAGETFSCE